MSALKTQILPLSDAAIGEAATLIRAGQPVAAPTETVYGLAADATDAAAVARIYAAKGRPSFNPLIVHVTDMAMARSIATFSPLADRLAAAFWPGPLTLVLPLASESPVARLVTAGLPTVAIRMPAHPAMRALIAASGVPLAAPSANASGSISPTSAAHVLRSLDGRTPLILDDGPTSAGLESTIVAVGEAALTLLRPGPVDADMLASVAGVPVIARGEGDAITAPGQLASHYAPGKPVLLNRTEPAEGAFHIGFGPGASDYNLSESSDLLEAAARLFAALHEGDLSDRACISIAPIPHEGIGIAINDRLARAAA
ncbi:L-threonylcarbamoyladenylate synthase [Sphingobium sp. CR28]|uniref:L-threonylcarbamoyladenylate synthase n=1 Tax=Sphingobium sp. CR28 TaxID=3400272 RepID=UPI003FF0C669